MMIYDFGFTIYEGEDEVRNASPRLKLSTSAN